MSFRGVNQQRYNPPWELQGQTWTWNQARFLGAGQPSRQQDWPNPQPVFWSNTWTQSNFVGMLSKTANPIPNNQYDWPNPTPVQWLQPWSWNQTTMQFQDRLPNRQQDWPNPTQPYVTEKTTTWSQTRMQFQDKLPAHQWDWPNPQPVQWYQSWTIRPIEELSVKPFHQHDWPNPKPVLWYQSWEVRHTQFRFQDKLPFHQYDWPNPQPIQWNNFTGFNDIIYYGQFSPAPPLVLPIRTFPKPFPYETWTVWSKPHNGRREIRRSWSRKR